MRHTARKFSRWGSCRSLHVYSVRIIYGKKCLAVAMRGDGMDMHGKSRLCHAYKIIA